MAIPKARYPAAAGTFYPREPQALREEIRQCYLHPLGPGYVPTPVPRPLAAPLGLFLPHAGYRYSGPVAAWGLTSLASKGVPQVVVILGPNHYGLGPPLASAAEGMWQTPLGSLRVDQELLQDLRRVMPQVQPSTAAHREEHSIEVLLPFLQFLYGEGFTFLPIALADHRPQTAIKVGRALAQILKDRTALLIASSDLSHYLPQEVAQKKDRLALEAILSLEPERLGRVVEEEGVNMCGPGPVMAVMEASRHMGSRNCRLLCYATSGDTSQNYTQVVGYAALSVE